MIELIDHNVGRMLDALERTGQADNTLVIFTSDHGEMLGDHGLLLKGCRFYEGLVHVPLILRWPGHIARRHHHRCAGRADRPGADPARSRGTADAGYMAGRSLLPLLSRKVAGHRDTVRCEYYAALRSLKRNLGDWSDSRARP